MKRGEEKKIAKVKGWKWEVVSSQDEFYFPSLGRAKRHARQYNHAIIYDRDGVARFTHEDGKISQYK